MSKKKTEINPDCADRLKDLLKRKGITQKTLADLAGYTPATVCGVIRKKRPLTLALAQDFAKALNVLPDFLLCNDDYETEAEKQAAAEKEKDIRLSFDGLKRQAALALSFLNIDYDVYLNTRIPIKDLGHVSLCGADFYALSQKTIDDYLHIYFRKTNRNSFENDFLFLAPITHKKRFCALRIKDFMKFADYMYRSTEVIFPPFIDDRKTCFNTPDDLTTYLSEREKADNVD